MDSPGIHCELRLRLAQALSAMDLLMAHYVVGTSDVLDVSAASPLAPLGVAGNLDLDAFASGAFSNVQAHDPSPILSHSGQRQLEQRV